MGAVRISILYPNEQGARFDFEHYTQNHMPRAIELSVPHADFEAVSAKRGVRAIESRVQHRVISTRLMCHFKFASVNAFLEAFLPNADELQGDIPNYTNIKKTVIQFNRVLISNLATDD